MPVIQVPGRLRQEESEFRPAGTSQQAPDLMPLGFSVKKPWFGTARADEDC